MFGRGRKRKRPGVLWGRESGVVAANTQLQTGPLKVLLLPVEHGNIETGRGLGGDSGRDSVRVSAAASGRGVDRLALDLDV